MKKVFALAALAVFLVAQAAFARTIPLEAGTEVMVKVTERIHSKNVKKGQVLSFEVDSPVTTPNGFVVIPAGAKAYGTVVSVTKAGMFGRRGQLQIDIDRATAWNGANVPLTSDVGGKGDNNTAVVATTAALIALPAIFFRGSNAVIEPGTIFRTRVAVRTLLEDNQPARTQKRPAVRKGKGKK